MECRADPIFLLIFLLASSVNGQVFCSTDAGDSWSKFSREFGEGVDLAWVPN